VLFSYVRDGVEKQGRMIGKTAHAYGLAFDIGGDKDGIEGPIDNELAVVSAISDVGYVKGFKSFVTERKNNCIHINCHPVMPGEETA